jgi:hypothetical protein
MENKTDWLRVERLSAPDPATPEESIVIGAAMKCALQALRRARQGVLSVRPSDETRDAFDALERARSEVGEFLQRED